MLHFFNNRLAVEANWLIDNDIVSLSNYKSMVHRGRLTILRKGTRGLAALVDYESMPEEMKTMVKDLIGDPYTFGLKDELSPYVTPWAEAAQFFNSYKPDGVRNLPADKVKRYYADACVLRAIDLFKEERRFAPHGHAATRWSAIIEHVKEIDVKEWPHRLPTNHLSLQRKFERFKRDGLESLVHKNYRGDEETGWTVAQNCSKIITEEQKALMMDLISDPRNLANTQNSRLMRCMVVGFVGSEGKVLHSPPHEKIDTPNWRDYFTAKCILFTFASSPSAARMPF